MLMHVYLRGKTCAKKTTHVPLHITGSRAEPYTPEISADSIRALLLACWPGAEELILNIGQAEKENTLHFFIKHIKSYHKAHSMDGSKVKGELLGIWKGYYLSCGSHIRLPLEDPQPASWPFCLQGLQEIHGHDGRSIYHCDFSMMQNIKCEVGKPTLYPPDFSGSLWHEHSWITRIVSLQANTTFPLPQQARHAVAIQHWG